MRKLTVFSEIAFFLGMIFLSVGMVFIIKSDFGISPVQSSAYVMHTVFPKITFGTFNYLIQFVLVVALVIILRRIRLRYLLSFLSGVLYGYTVDFFTYIMRSLEAQGMVMRIVFFVIGFFIAATGITLFFRTNVPLMPYDIFVTDLAKKKNFNKNNVKIIFDICSLILGISLSLIFYKKLVGIGIGTVIIGLTMGITIKFLGKLIDKFIVFKPIVKKLDY